jgi:hypothetical protein
MLQQQNNNHLHQKKPAKIENMDVYESHTDYFLKYFLFKNILKLKKYKFPLNCKQKKFCFVLPVDYIFFRQYFDIDHQDYCIFFFKKMEIVRSFFFGLGN